MSHHARLLCGCRGSTLRPPCLCGGHYIDRASSWLQHLFLADRTSHGCPQEEALQGALYLIQSTKPRLQLAVFFSSFEHLWACRSLVYVTGCLLWHMPSPCPFFYFLPDQNSQKPIILAPRLYFPHGGFYTGCNINISCWVTFTDRVYIRTWYITGLEQNRVFT